MPLESGAKFGPYEIVALTSSGAGGEVYKASDTRLNRAVSIKILPPELSAMTQMKERLRNEAKTISSLNHPNICALYDVGEQDGSGYLVTEFVDGETLAERLKQGPLELEEALTVAIAIADALDKAHRRGITHRALNPSNIRLTPGGVKLTDFGVANLEIEAGPLLAASTLPTRTSHGPLAGIPDYAAPYLAPEQWEGREADGRTDVFTLGVILYEMIAGKPAFEGKNQAMLIAAIQTIDPEPVSKAQPMAPPALDYTLKRCLAKDPKQRLQTALDLMSQLQWIAGGGSQVGVPAAVAARRRKRDRVVWIALAAASAVVLALTPGAYYYFRGTPEPEEVRFVLSNMGQTAPTTGSPVSISPNGRWIIRSGNVTPGGGSMEAVLLNSVTKQTLFKENNLVQPFWSPDSRSVAFFEDGKLKAADVAGGPARIICEWPVPIGGGAWNSDGVILISSGGLIQRVSAAGGQPTPVSAFDASKKESEHIAPAFLPDGRHYLFLAIAGQASENTIYVGDINSKERKLLFASESRALYAAPGYIFFNRGSTVFAQPFDANKLAFTGEPVRVADNVPSTSGNNNVSANLQNAAASFAVSQTGVLTYRIGTVDGQAQPANANIPERALIWFDRSGSRIGQVGGPAGYAGVDVSPDGKQIAVHVHDAAGGDSWFFDSAQGRMQRLTFDARQDNSAPLWSPDGLRIAFSSKRNGKWGLYVKLVDGSGKEELITESELPKSPMSWSPDGKTFVYWVNDPQTRGDVWAVSVTGEKKPIPILNTPNNELHPQLSPDGQWIAYVSSETGRNEVYIKPFPEGPGKWQVSTDGGIWPRWRHDGKELYFVLAPNILASEIHVSGPSITAGAPHPLFALANDPGPATNAVQVDFHRYAVSADGQRFLIPQPPGAAAAVAGGGIADQLINIADQGGNAGLSTNSLMVVLNWTRLLQRK